MSDLWKDRKLVWFSCGAASACVAKISLEKWPECEVLYCDTSINEHPDSLRFMADVEKWIQKPIVRLRSTEMPSMDIYDVFYKEKYIAGRFGAPCTRMLKKEVRYDYQDVGDIHIMGYTADEEKRIKLFKEANPEILTAFPLVDAGMKKRDCFIMLKNAGVALPEMYRLGYKNNNCIGCVKGGAGYWNKIRVDFPDVFAKMAKAERDIGAKICKVGDKRVFLDELPPNVGRYKSEPDIECGPHCQIGGAA